MLVRRLQVGQIILIVAAETEELLPPAPLVHNYITQILIVTDGRFAFFLRGLTS